MCVSSTSECGASQCTCSINSECGKQLYAGTHPLCSWTRTLPGHDNPIVNPYKGPRRPQRPQQKLEEEVEAAAKQE